MTKKKPILWLVISWIGIFAFVGTSKLNSQQLEKSFEPPPPKYEIRSERNIMVPMRDGVKLATDIWFPEGVKEKLPAILVRTPYRKDGHPTVRFTLYGYIVVAQDVRGKFGSEGTFTYLADDADDGYDTISWIVKQPWSNGHVTSYFYAKGHRIRLDISSSDFPNYERNLNTGGKNYDETKWVVADNKIHHSKQYPSHVLLPVIR